MPYADLTILALFVFAYCAVSGRAERTAINGALVFTLSGLTFGAGVIAHGVTANAFSACPGRDESGAG
ncbi:hypothetical protein JF535_05425 [Microbulbifer salipaludis]|uniref:Uncharacterized protein n=1 Tax=Microbulbifer salipaludis TaxID=187980 RepID=A0ABS3E4R8_9GAMM|nr:hypothetical protein [Microbulbifer salipaludis]MBN8430293.1 hypothetical protein [Microbulbifer salipaludis]